MRVAPLQQDVLLGSHDEERRAKGEHEEAFEIDVGPIHDVEGAGLGADLVEDVDVVHFAVGNADKRGDVASQVQQRVHLHGSLAPAELGPREQREAQVDGGRVQSVEGLIEIQADRIAGVQGPRDANQDLGEISIDPPVARLVGVGQCRACDLAAESHVVELGAERTQAGFDIAEAFAVAQLGEGHAQELVPAGESLLLVVAPVTSDTLLKLIGGKVIQELRKDGATEVHAPLLALLRVRPWAPFSSSAISNLKNPNGT